MHQDLLPPTKQLQLGTLLLLPPMNWSLLPSHYQPLRPLFSCGASLSGNTLFHFFFFLRNTLLVDLENTLKLWLSLASVVLLQLGVNYICLGEDVGKAGMGEAEKLQVAMQVRQSSPQECALSLDVCIRL